MRKYVFLLPIILLAACDNAGQPIDAQKFLSDLEGPKVPTVKDTILENAKSAEAAGEWVTANQLYQQVMVKNPENTDIMIALAETYRRIGEFDKAISLYDAAIDKNSSLIAAKEGKALALLSKGDFDTPAPLFEDVLKTDATRWKTLNGLGILFTTRGMHPEAQQYFREALKYNPGNTSILNNLGLSQALTREYDVASDTLLQAGALAAAGGNDRKRIDLNLALVYAVAGRIEDARMVAEHYYSGAILNNNMGLYAHLAKDNALAKDYLNMALTDSKTYYDKAWQNLQTISTSGSGGSQASSAQPVALQEKPAAKKPKTKKKVEAAPEIEPISPPSSPPIDDISNILLESEQE
ncbi:MAG: tetratricopeptide repeat protein [Alphaproteobacteria bacterium]